MMWFWFIDSVSSFYFKMKFFAFACFLGALMFVIPAQIYFGTFGMSVDAIVIIPLTTAWFWREVLRG